jgi:hypothetical protein
MPSSNGPGESEQLYWHTSAPSYPPLQTIPENRVYVSAGAAEVFIKSFIDFSHGAILDDAPNAPLRKL